MDAKITNSNENKANPVNYSTQGFTGDPYLGHDYYTDVSTFDYDEDDVINGDIVISLDTIRTNAEQFGKTYDDELHHVIIHGILHLGSINAKGLGEREIMEENENKALALSEGQNILKKTVKSR